MERLSGKDGYIEVISGQSFLRSTSDIPNDGSSYTNKKRVTQRKIYSTRDDAKTEIFNFIEMFYNPIKRHSHTGGVSPAQFEEDYFSRLVSV